MTNAKCYGKLGRLGKNLHLGEEFMGSRTVKSDESTKEGFLPLRSRDYSGHWVGRTELLERGEEIKGELGREASPRLSSLHGGSGMVISGFDVTTPTPQFLLNVFSEIVKKVNYKTMGQCLHI